jgi:hypothetical protein
MRSGDAVSMLIELAIAVFVAAYALIAMEEHLKRPQTERNVSYRLTPFLALRDFMILTRPVAKGPGSTQRL